MPRGEAVKDPCELELGERAVMPPQRPRRRLLAQAVVEFAIGSIVFLMVIFGTIDFGRVIFMYSELHNAVRDGARYATINPSNTAGIQGVVLARAPSLGLSTGAVTSLCDPNSCASGGTVTVRASLQFQAVTQQLLHIGPVTLTASATDVIE